MNTRLAAISIIVEDVSSVEKLNGLLHEFAQCIVGRMGIPYRSRGVHVIMVAIDAPQSKIAALSGRIGNLHGVTAKVAYSS